MMTIAISSCDEDTLGLGDSLTSNTDKFLSIAQTYQVQTKSIMTDSVLATSLYQYLGKIKDPETGSYITSDYMARFNLLENESTSTFPAFADIAKDESGQAVADSCVLRIMISSFQGDSLTAMKMKVTELEVPVPNSSQYYTDFDPEEEGYLRSDKDASGNPLKDNDGNDIKIVKQNKLYSVSDLTQSDSLRNVLRGTNYYQYITIPFSDSYTDKDGNTYKGYDATKKGGSGYGTYLLRMYYSHPEYYKNSDIFARKVCPGFYFKTLDGQGNMIEVANTQILVYYHYTKDGATINSSRALMSTSEVLQTNHIINDKLSMKKLEAIDTCTFLKTPSGIFTEVTLPIDSIKWYGRRNALGELIRDAKGDSITHLNDTLMSAKIVFQTMTNHSALSNKLLKEPTNLLMVPRDRLYTFFETNSMSDNITTYLATYNSVQKTYTFSALTGLINSLFDSMKAEITNADGTINQEKLIAYKRAHPNWNKVVLVPVSVSTTTSGSTTTISAISNSLSISSVRLVGGTNNTKHIKPAITITYSTNE